jgi:Protein of unknown function (DUF1494)/Prokaryotic N-terminal methylation motif
MKKRSFSLIEMVISFALLSLLLTTLFFWYHSLSKRREEVGRLRAPLMEERYTHQRLQWVIPKAESPFFIGEDGSLVFLFDRGPCPLPDLSGKVLAKLYHDPSLRTLCLSIWPKPTQDNLRQLPMQTVVLLDGIASCSFEFYSPPDPFQLPVDPDAVGSLEPTAGWQNQWRAAYQSLPAFVKLILVRDSQQGLEERSIEFLFDLPVPLIYPQEAV